MPTAAFMIKRISHQRVCWPGTVCPHRQMYLTWKKEKLQVSAYTICVCLLENRQQVLLVLLFSIAHSKEVLLLGLVISTIMQP